jgi:hypothetical protein
MNTDKKLQVTSFSSFPRSAWECNVRRSASSVVRNFLLTAILYLLSFILYPLSFSYASDCQWVETIGEAVTENLTADETRSLALNRARNKAIENVSGVNISGNTLVKDYSLIADLIRVAGSGHILQEKVLKWETETFQKSGDTPPVTIYRVKIESCVKGELSGDPYFKVIGELNRQVFMDREEAKIKVSCTKDCYLTILNLTAENKVRVLLPNEYERSKKIRGGEGYSFPPAGLSLEMHLLPGHKKDAEAFILIATKERFDLLPLLPFGSAQGRLQEGIEGRSEREFKIEDFYKGLLTIPSDSRTEEILLYEIREK